MYTQNQGYDESEGLIGGKFHTLNWNIDNYQNWLSQNGLNLNGNIAMGAIEAISGLNLANSGREDVKSGEVIDGAISYGSVLSGLSKIKDNLMINYQHGMEANSSRGLINGANINIAGDMNGFFFYQKSIKNEFAKIIDDYFSMYGYKVNELKIPNINGRTNWNFVKLLLPNIEGTLIPEADLNKYKKQLEEGITFWHNYNTFRDYSQTNSIVI